MKSWLVAMLAASWLSGCSGVGVSRMENELGAMRQRIQSLEQRVKRMEHRLRRGRRGGPSANAEGKAGKSKATLGDEGAAGPATSKAANAKARAARARKRAEGRAKAKAKPPAPAPAPEGSP